MAPFSSKPKVVYGLLKSPYVPLQNVFRLCSLLRRYACPVSPWHLPISWLPLRRAIVVFLDHQRFSWCFSVHVYTHCSSFRGTNYAEIGLTLHYIIGLAVYGGNVSCTVHLLGWLFISFIRHFLFVIEPLQAIWRCALCIIWHQECQVHASIAVFIHSNKGMWTLQHLRPCTIIWKARMPHKQLYQSCKLLYIDLLGIPIFPIRSWKRS